MVPEFCKPSQFARPHSREFEFARANEPCTDAAHAPARAHLTRGEDAGREAPTPGAVLRAVSTRLPSPISAPRGGSITCTSRGGGSGRAHNVVTDRARSDVRSPLGSDRRGRALPPQTSLRRDGPNSSGRRGQCPPPPRFPRLRTQVSRRPRPPSPWQHCLREGRPAPDREFAQPQCGRGHAHPHRQHRLAASGTRANREVRGETHLPGAAPRRGRCLCGLLAASLRTQLPTAIGQERWDLFQLLYDIDVDLNLFGVDS